MKTFKHIHNDPTLCELAKIETNGKRYYTLPDGTKLPSVTTFLSTFKKASIIKWRKRVGEAEANKISAKASRRGTKFHSLMESYLKNEPASKFLTKDLMPHVRQSFEDMKETLDRIDNIHYIETMLYSTSVGLAGQVDLIAEFDGVPSIIDFKTSNKVKREDWILDYFLQTTAYSLMYEDMTGVKCPRIVVLISVDNEPDPQVFVRDRKEYVPILYDRIVEFRKGLK